MRLLAAVVVGVGLAGGEALAQATAPDPGTTTTSATLSGSEAEEKQAWALGVSAYAYIVPDSRDYLQPTVMADRGRLHLEARYSYEDRDTGSAWVGLNFSAGDTVTLELTPMLGVVFGNTTGIAPGLRGTLGWRKLELSSESEYLFDTDDSSASFFYSWSELSLAPVEWLRFGAVVDRTKLYQNEFDIQRGFLVGVSYRSADFTTYVFNPDASTPTVVLGVGLSW